VRLLGRRQQAELVVVRLQRINRTEGVVRSVSETRTP
jgi:hypothetical protein